ncbi:DUF881 domain-containing protein [Ruania suaedae]|uniref:DUF881 domain-containing protein n=1 Tax=Ruania suaedae TaxID=2897774 RepID=UPI001E3ABF8E|nr:DUF881 domain-containing protein [Ruania suaedae]UFU03099.1 DUF881 domain-containing protein [Ruania suaedae]
MSGRSTDAHRTGMSLGVGVVGVLAGLLFATNASLFAGEDNRQPVDLEDLVRSEAARLDETNARYQSLEDEVNELLARDASVGTGDPLTPATEMAAGRTAVSGPGVTVSLSDSPLIHDAPEGVSADSLLVHQQDLEGVINALWSGGAEAITVQGHRLGPLTDIRCVGNVLLVDGNVYSPPYIISGIGEVDALRAGLDQSPAVRTYREYVDRVSLGYSVEDEERLEMPRIEGGLSMEYARLPGEEPISWQPAAGPGLADLDDLGDIG